MATYESFACNDFVAVVHDNGSITIEWQQEGVSNVLCIDDPQEAVNALHMAAVSAANLQNSKKTGEQAQESQWEVEANKLVETIDQVIGKSSFKGAIIGVAQGSQPAPKPGNWFGGTGFKQPSTPAENDLQPEYHGQDDAELFESETVAQWDVPSAEEPF